MYRVNWITKLPAHQWTIFRWGSKASTNWSNTWKHACYCAFMYTFTEKHVFPCNFSILVLTFDPTGKGSINYPVPWVVHVYYKGACLESRRNQLTTTFLSGLLHTRQHSGCQHPHWPLESSGNIDRVARALGEAIPQLVLHRRTWTQESPQCAMQSADCTQFPDCTYSFESCQVQYLELTVTLTIMQWRSSMSLY